MRIKHFFLNKMFPSSSWISFGKLTQLFTKYKNLMSFRCNKWLVSLPFQYNTLLSNMETKYSVATVCREDGRCHPLDPGKNYNISQCVESHPKNRNKTNSKANRTYVQKVVDTYQIINGKLLLILIFTCSTVAYTVGGVSVIKKWALFQISRRSWQSPGTMMSCCSPGRDGEILLGKYFARITRDMSNWPTKLPHSMV